MKRAFLLLGLSAIACDVSTEPTPLHVPDVYAFESRFDAEGSSVSYGGQVFRHVLITSVALEMDTIAEEIDAGVVFEAGEVAQRLSFYYDFDVETAGDLRHGIRTEPAPLQGTWAELGGADLVSKTAGNDPQPQHRDWSRGIVGWQDSMSPEAVVRSLIDRADALAVAYSSSEVPLDPNGEAIEVWYVSPEGIDHKQLLQKFLLGAVAYSQGTDDYLDEGLAADNTDAEEDEAYTALEQQWDEGFGYWGGARHYLEFSDAELAGVEGRPEYVGGHHDANGDGKIDLKAEYSFGASINAAKRDLGAAELGVATDYTSQTMQGFVRGRAIIAAADGPLSTTARADLEAARDEAVDGWERALAATAVHYFNDTLQDMNASDDYAFADHAKHWSELKGFLLMLQFNPAAQVSAEVLESIHDRVGMAPVAPGQPGAQDYAAGLVAARGLLVEAYGFDPALAGDDAGEGGW